MSSKIIALFEPIGHNTYEIHIINATIPKTDQEIVERIWNSVPPDTIPDLTSIFVIKEN